MKALKAVLFVLIGSVLSAQAVIISTNDIFLIPDNATGSGNGTLDYRLFTFSGSEVKNADPQNTYNYDNANSELPNAGGADIASFQESFLTSGADLKSFYLLNFPNLTGVPGETELAVFLDLNETGTAAQTTNSLDLFDIVINPSTINGNAPVTGGLFDAAVNDILGGGASPVLGEQDFIDQIYTGGTLVSTIDPSVAPMNLDLTEQGAGFADWIIFSRLDPFTLDDNDLVLINLSMSKLNNGAEEIFISGTFSSEDIIDVIPEPAVMSSIALAGLLMLFVRRLAR